MTVPTGIAETAGTSAGTAVRIVVGIATKGLDPSAALRRTARGEAESRPAAARTGRRVRIGPDGTTVRPATRRRGRGVNLSAAHGSATRTSTSPGRRCPSGLASRARAGRPPGPSWSEQGRRRIRRRTPGGCRNSGRRRPGPGLAACPGGPVEGRPYRGRTGDRGAGRLSGRTLVRGHRRAAGSPADGRGPRTSRRTRGLRASPRASGQGDRDQPIGGGGGAGPSRRRWN